MNAFEAISICFGLLALWVWKYDPPTIIESDDGGVTFEHMDSGRANNKERFRLIVALAIMWGIVIVVMYHETVLRAIQDFLNL